MFTVKLLSNDAMVDSSDTPKAEARERGKNEKLVAKRLFPLTKAFPFTRQVVYPHTVYLHYPSQLTVARSGLIRASCPSGMVCSLDWAMSSLKRSIGLWRPHVYSDIRRYCGCAKKSEYQSTS